MSAKTFNRGDTFSRACRYKADNVNPTDLTDITIKSQIRQQSGALVAELVVTKRDQDTQTGVYVLTCADTSLWPIGTLEWNIRYTTAGGITSTETLELKVIRSVTHGDN